MRKDWLLLTPLASYGDAGLLLILVFLGPLFATLGAGRYALDARIEGA